MAREAPKVSGRNFAQSLPDNVEQRERKMLAAFKRGEVFYSWSPVRVSERLTINVTTDAVRWGDSEESIRLAGSLSLCQKMADHVGGMLLTGIAADAAWRDSDAQIDPLPMKISSKTSALIEQHDKIEEKLGDRRGIVTAWKNWTISAAAFSDGHATNYGWHVEGEAATYKGIKLYPTVSDSGARVIQGFASAHSALHADYSQQCRIMKRAAMLDGKRVDLAELITGPQADLISHEGPLLGFRHPRVAVDTFADPESDLPRITFLGERGPDVAKWQSQLVADGFGEILNPKNKADGIHGPATERATERWLESNSGSRDTMAPETQLITGHIQSTNYRKAGRDSVKWIVLHSTESATDAAKAVASWFGSGAGAPMARAHYVVDTSSAYSCVAESEISFCAPGANRDGIQIELCGRAMSTNWLHGCATTLDRAAEIVARACRRWDVPIREVKAAEMMAGERGICTHAEVTRGVGRGKTNHVDPGGPDGSRWPMAEFLALVRAKT